MSQKICPKWSASFCSAALTATCYAGFMISYKRSNALQPEKESVLSFNLMPLLVFVLGFVVARSLLSTVRSGFTRDELK